MIKISCLHEKKKQYQINLVKTCYTTKPFRHSRIQDTKKFKRIKKIWNDLSSVNLQKQRCSKEKSVLRIFTKFTGKHLYQGFRPATLLNNRLWYRCFTVNFVKFLGTPFYKTPLDDCFWIYHWDAHFQKQPVTDVFQNKCS